MPDRIHWPWYLALFVVGMGLVFGGIAGRDSLGTLSNVVVPAGGIAALMGPVLGGRALIRRHGPGPMLIVLLIIVAALALAGALMQRHVAR
jgi:hypothetical protein